MSDVPATPRRSSHHQINPSKRSIHLVLLGSALTLSSLVTLRAWSAQRCQRSIINLLGTEIKFERETNAKRLNHYLSGGDISLKRCTLLGDAEIQWRSNSLGDQVEIMYFKRSSDQTSSWRNSSKDSLWLPLKKLPLTTFSP